MTKKRDSSLFQFDSNVVCAVTHLRKIIFLQNWLVMSLSGPFCVAHAHWKLNQHNQNFMILVDSLHKGMSKC